MRGRSNRSSGAAAIAAAVLLASAGCSAASETVRGSGSAGPSAGAAQSGSGSGGPLASPGSTGPSGGATGGGQPTGAGASEGGVSTTVPTHDSTKAPRLPTPGGMQPPTATAAHAVGCTPLSSGGWQATFVVTLTGGQLWAVLPALGPATPTGDDEWTIVVQEGADGPQPIRLDRVQVGGGAPFRTAYVPLGPGVATQVACPS